MAKRIFSTGGVTFTATASGSQATSGGYLALTGASSTQTTDILEVLVSGKATASTVAAIYCARQGTLGTGGATALAGQNSDGPMHFASATLAAVVVAAVTYVTNQVIPSSTTTDGKIQLGLNLFGGIVRWNASPTQQMTMVGNTAPGGGVVVYNNSSATGSTGLGDAHIIYETY